MLEHLPEVENALPDWLAIRKDWKSMFIDYHPPFVERLWIQHSAFRVMLHRIHACAPEQALFHTHPWPSAMWIIAGGPYEMAVGFGPASGKPPPHAAKVIYKPSREPGAAMLYEMTDQNGWHYVRPLSREEPVYTVMVTGPVWKGQPTCKPDYKLKSLDDKTIADLKHKFSRLIRGHKNKTSSPSHILAGLDK